MAFAAPTPGTESSEKEKQDLVPLWNVVLLDDDYHTYDYVIEMLCRLFFKTVDESYQHAVEVDSSGRTIVMTCDLQAAEFARDQIHGYGADWRMESSQGSMSAILEPAT
ncbi:ATP-dependent Clp protease adaptor ClpS [uncultured Paludibaculum sp.]|uniref:ATP-dependent Clp protease adaptor ClpS n=1 Tax=uncultured Paludibaculum sp. TaxID=1765020 RepID=UPI002AAB1B53|nr:ATP-dependent Clp protease adaptor ClpS [uncultured Paludibaculum sp.]